MQTHDTDESQARVVALEEPPESWSSLPAYRVVAAEEPSESWPLLPQVQGGSHLEPPKQGFIP